MSGECALHLLMLDSRHKRSFSQLALLAESQKLALSPHSTLTRRFLRSGILYIHVANASACAQASPDTYRHSSWAP